MRLFQHFRHGEELDAIRPSGFEQTRGDQNRHVMRLAVQHPRRLLRRQARWRLSQQARETMLIFPHDCPPAVWNRSATSCNILSCSAFALFFSASRLSPPADFLFAIFRQPQFRHLLFPCWRRAEMIQRYFRDVRPARPGGIADMESQRACIFKLCSSIAACTASPCQSPPRNGPIQIACPFSKRTLAPADL